MNGPTGVRTLAAMFLCACSLTVSVSAQMFTGRVEVTIDDSSGVRIPGVSVVLTGPTDLARVTDDRGEAHFMNLPVGVYALQAQRQGLNRYTVKRVEVVSSGTTAVTARLASAAAGSTEPSEIAVVTPDLDARRQATTTNITFEELQSIPSARDPWVMLQTVPTVYVDRVNVGGSESGQQSNYNAKGAQDTDNTWVLDGIPVTDMAATGTSALDYDFDGIEELAVTTGGADPENVTGGVQVNVVLKQGLNLPHAGLRAYFENDKLQGNNLPPEVAEALGASTDDCRNSGFTKHCGNRMDRYFDRGFDLGGPVFKDRLWAWGTMSQTTIRLLTLTGPVDDTLFQSRALKAEGLATNTIRANFSFYQNEKTQEGRDVGPLRPPETAWNQSGPTKYYKGGADFALSDHLFAAARGAYVNSSFLLDPVGGLDTDYYLDSSGVAHNTFYQSQSKRLQRFAGGDAIYFAGKQELKAGGTWRSTPIDTQRTWPGSHLIATWVGYPNMYVQVARDYRAATEAQYSSGYFSDTISLDRATIAAGVRVDHQVASVDAASVPSVPGVPILPAVSAPAIANVYKWNNVTPRLGLTYAVDQSRKTLLRASYAMFASQLPGTAAAFVSSIQYSYAYYNAVDRTSTGNRCTADMAPPVAANGCDGVAELGEILFSQGLQGYTGFDPTNPARLTSVNKVDPNIKAPLTHELLFGVDRELMANFSASAAFTYRRMIDLLWDPLTGVRRSDYRQTGSLVGTATGLGSFNVPLYALNPSAVPPGGSLTETNRPGYHQRSWGVEFSARKRMSNRWMGRFGFSTNDWREYFDDPTTSTLDPTPAPAADPPARPFAGPQVNGGLVVRKSSGSGTSDIYLVSPRYQFIANGLFEGPWGLDFAANLVTRQGYVEPFFRSNVATGDPLGGKTVMLVKNVDDFRLDPVSSLDARVEKKFKFSNVNLAVDFDVFNLFNTGTVLERQYDERAAGPTGFGQVLEIMAPRVARFGVRFFF